MKRPVETEGRTAGEPRDNRIEVGGLSMPTEACSAAIGSRTQVAPPAGRSGMGEQLRSRREVIVVRGSEP